MSSVSHVSPNTMECGKESTASHVGIEFVTHLLESSGISFFSALPLSHLLGLYGNPVHFVDIATAYCTRRGVIDVQMGIPGGDSQHYQWTKLMQDDPLAVQLCRNASFGCLLGTWLKSGVDHGFILQQIDIAEGECGGSERLAHIIRGHPNIQIDDWIHNGPPCTELILKLLDYTTLEDFINTPLSRILGVCLVGGVLTGEHDAIRIADAYCFYRGKREMERLGENGQEAHYYVYQWNRLTIQDGPAIETMGFEEIMDRARMVVAKASL